MKKMPALIASACFVSAALAWTNPVDGTPHTAPDGGDCTGATCQRACRVCCTHFVPPPNPHYASCQSGCTGMGPSVCGAAPFEPPA